MELEKRLQTQKTIIHLGSKLIVPFAATVIAFFPSKSNAQFNPAELPSELRGFVEHNGFVIDSLFAYNTRNDSLLDKTILSEADTVNVQGDTVTVPNFYRFVILTDKASTPDTVEGATLGDTLYFKAKAQDGIIYELISKNGKVIHESGTIKRVDMKIGTTISIDYSKNILNIPEEFQLYQNYPNPFNPKTTIRYDVKQRDHVHLTVYDITGRVVKKLVDATKTTGGYEVTWDGTDKSNTLVASGIYIYRLKTGNTVQTKKMTLLK